MRATFRKLPGAGPAGILLLSKILASHDLPPEPHSSLAPRNYFLSWGGASPKAGTEIARFKLKHPSFTPETKAAQKKLAALQGLNFFSAAAISAMVFMKTPYVLASQPRSAGGCMLRSYRSDSKYLLKYYTASNLVLSPSLQYWPTSTLQHSSRARLLAPAVGPFGSKLRGGNSAFFGMVLGFYFHFYGPAFSFGSSS